jgi:cytidylate kinase
MHVQRANTIVITVSRQLGSGGTAIARQVSRRLGFRYVDREILSRATEHLGSEEDNIAFREERVSGFMEDLLRGFIYGPPESAYIPPPVRPVYDIDLFSAEADIIRKIADAYDAVIVGRAAFHVLRDRPGLIKVFLHAPEASRIRRVMETRRITDHGKAAGMIRESDSSRRRFIESVAGVQWTDACCYHLSVDTDCSGFADTENMIAKLTETVKSKLGR